MQIKWLGRLVGWKNKVAKNQAAATGGRPSEGCVSDKIVPLAEPKSLGALVRMMERDYQVQYLKYILTANVSAVKVSVTVDGPGSSDPKAKGIAKKGEELWAKSVVSMMDSFGFGRQAFEKSNDYDPAVPCTYVKKLEPIEFEDSKLKLTPETHHYDGFKVRINGPDEEDNWVDVKPADSWWLALDATPRNPHGKSQYRGAVEEAWRDKRENVRNLKTFVKRFAIRGGVVHGPMTKTDEMTGQKWSCPDEFQAAAESLYTGGSLYLPNDPHPNPEMAAAGKYETEFEEASAINDPAPILAALDHDDVAILRAGGVPEKAAIEGDGGGSYAMLTQQMLILFARVDSLVSQFVSSFQSYVMDPMSLANYGEGGPKFTVTAVKLTNRPDSFVIELLKGLATNPQFASLILSGGVNLRSVLESVGLPVTPELEQVAAQVAQQFAATVAAVKAGPGADPNAAGDPGAQGGEFGNLGRRQLMNNWKAVDDVLEAVASGTMKSDIAQSKLETLGVNPDRAAKMIAGASDGTVDAADTLSMANHLDRQQRMFRKFLGSLSVKKKVEPATLERAIDAIRIGPRGLIFKNAIRILEADLKPEDFRGAPAVPSWDQLAEAAIRISNGLFDDLQKAFEAGAPMAELEAIRKQIEELNDQVRAGAVALGLLAPWKPKQRKTGVIKFGPSKLADWFPWIQKAVDFITRKKVVTPQEFKQLTIDQQQKSFTAPGIEDRKELSKLRDNIAAGAEVGESLAEFRKRVGDELALTRAQQETVFRTNTHQGYVVGFDKGMKSQAVKEAFPAVMYSATPDDRVRDLHWMLDGFVCLRTDPAYKVLLRALKDWNCRCNLIPLSLEDAEAEGLKTIKDIPAAVLAKYGSAV